MSSGHVGVAFICPDNRLVSVLDLKSLNLALFNPILHGGEGWIPPLLTLVLNGISGIQAIVLMFSDFS